MKRIVLTLMALGLLAGGCTGRKPDETASAPPGGAPPGAATTSASTSGASPGKPAGKEVILPSGLKYVDHAVGTGDSPKTGQRVTVHYTGTLLDGTKFDSSVDRKEPFAFTIGRGEVIKGWDKGVATMKPGGKRKLIVLMRGLLTAQEIVRA